jgi:hypothetical protein
MASTANKTATIKPEVPTQARVKSLAVKAANLKNLEEAVSVQLRLNQTHIRTTKPNFTTKSR